MVTFVPAPSQPVEKCAICLNHLNENVVGHQDLRTESLIHFFHENCISSSLVLQTTCPICRTEIDPNNLRTYQIITDPKRACLKALSLSEQVFGSGVLIGASVGAGAAMSVFGTKDISVRQFIYAFSLMGAVLPGSIIGAVGNLFIGFQEEQKARVTADYMLMTALGVSCIAFIVLNI